MPFAEGHVKLGGRKKGTKNKDVELRETVKETLTRLGFNCAEYLINEVLPNVKPAERGRIVLELMSYESAKLKSLEVSGSIGGMSSPVVQITLPSNTRELEPVTALAIPEPTALLPKVEQQEDPR